jgi:hypothetical protein
MELVRKFPAILIFLSLVFAQSFGAQTLPAQKTLRMFDSADARETVRDLLSHMNANAEVAQAVRLMQSGNISAAQSVLAQHFRNRRTPLWNLSTQPLSASIQASAENAAKGNLQGGLVPLFYTFHDNQVDWHLNATDVVAGQSHNNEWQWQLNRMAFWSDLARAYRVTGDERYARAFARQLATWMQQCPEPDHMDNTPRSSWRTIEAGIRTGQAWMDAYESFRQSPSLSDEELLQFVDSFLQHGEYLRKYHTRLNWLTMEMGGLYTIGAMFPEFTEAREWRFYAASTMAEQAHTQFLPDGAQMELSTGYQNVVLDSCLHIAEIAQQLGYQNELPANYVESFEKGYDWQVKIATPNDELPHINDSWPTGLASVMRKAVRFYPARKDFLWFATNHHQGQPPQQTSFFMNWSGLAAMRSGWGQQENYLLYRLGPIGAGHQHQDSLGVALWSYGREILFSEGGGSYEQSKWRQWATSSYAHNTVIVDGLAQNVPTGGADVIHDANQVSQKSVDAHWISTPQFDFAEGSYVHGFGADHLRIARQRRDVLFIKPNMYVIADRMVPLDAASHSYQARWQILSVKTSMDAHNQAFATLDANQPNLVIVPLLTQGLASNAVSAQQEPEILGWNVRKDMNPQNVPATTLLHTLQGTGPQIFLTLLLPLRAGETDPVIRVEEQSDRRSALVFFSDHTHYLISAEGGAGITVKSDSGTIMAP